MRRQKLRVKSVKAAHILARVGSGDTTAFVEAYDLYAPKLYRHALYRTSSHEAAEDIMSQTFLKAWEFIAVGSGQVKHLRAFLYKIADNLIVDHYRGRSHEALSITETIERTLADPGRTEDQVDVGLRMTEVWTALGRLKEGSRELLIMRHLDGLSIAEIAEIRQKSKNSVYVALHRATKELKKYVQPKDSEKN